MGIANTQIQINKLAPVAQLDRASDFGSEGSGFESLRAHLKYKNLYILTPTDRLPLPYAKSTSNPICNLWTAVNT